MIGNVKVSYGYTTCTLATYTCACTLYSVRIQIPFTSLPRATYIEICCMYDVCTQHRPPGPKSKEVFVQGHTLYGYYNTPKSHYYVEYSFCIVQGIKFSYIHILFYIYVLRICISIPKSGPEANEITYPPASTGLKRRLKWARGQAVRVGE